MIICIKEYYVVDNHKLLINPLTKQIVIVA